jgi:hypothetical protein
MSYKDKIDRYRKELRGWGFDFLDTREFLNPPTTISFRSNYGGDKRKVKANV